MLFRSGKEQVLRTPGEDQLVVLEGGVHSPEIAVGAVRARFERQVDDPDQRDDRVDDDRDGCDELPELLTNGEFTSHLRSPPSLGEVHAEALDEDHCDDDHAQEQQHRDS